MANLALGLDEGSSGIKASLLDIHSGKVVGSCKSPPGDEELDIVAPKDGWAQQDPNVWWAHTKVAVAGAMQAAGAKPGDVPCIGVSYQMHGGVFVDVNGEPLMDAIIWCDGRTAEQKERVEKSNKAREITDKCLNLPGHFTASKLAWFKENHPDLYARLDKVLLPGHYILRRATGESTVTASGLSEGVFWNFREMGLSNLVMQTLELEGRHIPEVKPTFGVHGRLLEERASELGLKAGTPFTFFGGDQPVNAWSLNVLEPGEVAAIAGTSAVVYGVTDQIAYDEAMRINHFLHVNSSTGDHKKLRIGKLGCINGAGISYRWARDKLGGGSYQRMDELAASVKGTEGLYYVPFGNGPERTQQDKNTGAHLIGLNLNKHTNAHVYRAIQEGVVYAMALAVGVMRDTGMPVNRIRVGKANMFLCSLFKQMFADTVQATVEQYDTDGAAGAARGAAVGAGSLSMENAFRTLEIVDEVGPRGSRETEYKAWLGAVGLTSKRY